jgi:alpha-tubulin suppressor-like RCC1 family protein
VNSGTWQGFPIPTYSYQWFVCTSQVIAAASTIDVPVGCSEIPSATSSTQVLVATSLIGKYIVARLDAYNSVGRATVFTASTSTVTSTPVPTTNPLVSGTRANGQVLTVSDGTWIASPSEMTTSHLWFRCTSAVATATSTLPSQCSAISGATSATYTQTSADAGRFVTARTTRTNSIGSTNLFSVATTASTSEPVSVSAPIVSGSAVYGSNLAVSKGEWQGFPEPGFNYQWFVCDNEVLESGTTTPDNCAETGFSSGDVTAMDSGGDHTCAILADQTVQCWGGNFSGQLGNGTRTDSSTPLDVQGITSAVSISAGGQHSCAVLENLTAHCWGDNTSGQLGDGTTTRSTTPVQVSGLYPVLAISAGSSSTCALLEDGTIKCWGLGSSSSPSTPTTVSGIATATSVSVGRDHSCAVLANGEIKCWGSGGFGQLGNDRGSSSSTPVSVSGIVNATSVSAGDLTTCATLSTGTVWCWGKLGTSTTKDLKPRTIYSITNAVSVSTSTAGSHGDKGTCVSLNTGEVRCWGSVSGGGIGPLYVTTNVMAVSGAAESISSGYRFSCALLSSGGVECWGGGLLGQLGTGNSNSSVTPRPVLRANVINIYDESYLGKFLIANVKASNGLSSQVFTRSTTAITLVPTYSETPLVSGSRVNGST